MPNAKTTLTMGERLTKARRNSGMTVAAMAARQGVDPRTINNWENDRTHPKRPVFEVWATVTGFPFEWLLYGDAWLGDEDDRQLAWTFDEAA